MRLRIKRYKIRSSFTMEFTVPEKQKNTFFCQNFRFVFHKSSSVAMTEREGNRVKEDRRSLIPIMGRRLERERETEQRKTDLA